MTPDEIIKRFGYRQQTRKTAVPLAKLHDAYLELARVIVEVCPETRETSLSLTRLEESMEWARKSITVEQ